MYYYIIIHLFIWINNLFNYYSRIILNTIIIIINVFILINNWL